MEAFRLFESEANVAHWRLTMRQIREILRLRFECRRSHVSIGKSCQISKTAVQECLQRAQAASLPWPLPPDLDDTALEARLYFAPVQRIATIETLPSWDDTHFELKKKGVTRMLLWQEYRESAPGGLGYSQYCKIYQEWLSRQRLSMRQEHKAGEKLFVDFAGATIPVYDPHSGECREAQIFVAAWGASGYSYAEAAWSQDLPSWIQCHVNALGFFGCRPQIVVPDNLKSGVTTPCRYDPEINPTYAEFAAHYKIAVIPARIYRPKDKAKAEIAVNLVTRWIVAVLRKRRFFNLAEVNQAIRELLVSLNARPFQKRAGSRQSLFELLDKPAAQPLPAEKYVYGELSQRRVNIDYHLVIDDHYYSVPYQLCGEMVTVRKSAQTIEVFFKNKRIFTHARRHEKWQHTTIPEHMPPSHRAHAEWTPSRIINWARTIGPATGEFCERLLTSKTHPEQGYRAWLGIYRLSRHYGEARIEAACRRGLIAQNYRYKAIKAMLLRGLDQQPLPSEVAPPSCPIHHGNIRGGSYYNASTKGDEDDNTRADHGEIEGITTLGDGPGDGAANEEPRIQRTWI